MPVKGALDFKKLNQWAEDLAAAGRDVDNAVAELLTEVKPFVAEELDRNLHQTSEQWTPDLAQTIEVSDVQKDGNFIYLEASVGGGNGNTEAAQAKEFGTTRQAAEPFFRPTFRGHLLKNRLKAVMMQLLQKYGVSK
jgi:HK97 gp10 family phage protein